MRKWRAENAGAVRSKEFKAGVAALRDSLVRSFSAIGEATLSGFAAERIVGATDVKNFVEQKSSPA